MQTNSRIKIEHDHEGNPNQNIKEKIISHIIGIAEIKGPEKHIRWMI
jgi:hypothetical protein